MAAWNIDERPAPKPCKENNTGVFEITCRDGRARLGKIHTQHGIVNTPCLLPVINPNIQTITPRDMWTDYGIEALITNSYVIWKHEHLKTKALADGVHALLDYPGAIMTDSGTFQSYMYGDVEVGVEEIISFQRNIRVDIGTMLDVFSRPDMDENEVKYAVEETYNRAKTSIDTAKDMMLNGPIQGGIFPDLRRKSALLMGQEPFTIHPIGGIVPIMEQHMYDKLAEIILETKPNLPAHRPTHLFGCGHPMLFPMAIALGIDLFDSAAYALFARDERLLCPWGTEKFDRITEWPITVPCVQSITPKQVREMSKEKKTEILARFNLEVTLAELSRCRQAIRDGRIWDLAKMRSKQHPALKKAWDFIETQQNQWIISSQNISNQGGWRYEHGSEKSDPRIIKSLQNLHHKWGHNDPEKLIIFYGTPSPWRMKLNDLILKIRAMNEKVPILITTPIGLIPYGIEDLHPFAHIEAEDEIWTNPPKKEFIEQQLSTLNIKPKNHLIADINQENLLENICDYLGEEIQRTAHRDVLFREQLSDKMQLFFGADPEESADLVAEVSFVVGGTGRARNVLDSKGNHLFSPSLTNGSLAATAQGGLWLSKQSSRPPSVVVDEHAEPFVRKGRNVFHGFVLSVDQNLKQGDICLIYNQDGEYIAVGKAECEANEMTLFKKGIAVSVRDGLKNVEGHDSKT